MPDYEYFDENGNPVDPAELGDDVEIVEEVIDDRTTPPPAPAAQQPAAGGHTVPKSLIAGAIAAVVLLGGGGAYGLSKIGDQHTVANVKAGASSQRAAVSSQVQAKTKPEIDACDGKQLRDAAWPDSSEPSKQLKVVGGLDLGNAFADALDAASTRAGNQTHILQLDADELGVYTQIPRERGEAESWQVVKVDTAGDLPRIISDTVGHGGDTDAAGACAQLPGGLYRVSGDGIPASAQGLREGQVELTVLKPDATDPDVVWAVAGDSLLRMELQYAPEDDENGR